MGPLKVHKGNVFFQVVYVTATFPYLMLLILLIRGLTLPGAMNGVVYYLYPEPSHLLDPQVVKASPPFTPTLQDE